MRLYGLKLRLKKMLYTMLGKDIMQLQIELYRYHGANIGKNVRAFSPITSGEPYLIKVGDGVTLSTGVQFLTHDNSAIKIFDNGTDLCGKITIGSNCFIGANTLLLPGVTLADDIVVGAGSVVTKSFHESKIIIGGNPAKKIGDFSDYKEKYLDCVFDFSGNNRIKKESIIHNNLSKLIIK